MDFLKSRVCCIVYLDWLLSNIVSYKAMLSLPRLTQLAPHRWVGAGHYLNCRLSAKWDKDHHFSPALTLSSLCWVLQTLKNALCVGEHLIDLLFFKAKKISNTHCNPLQGSTGKYRENPDHKTGNLQWEQGSPVMKAGFSLWELTYREKL